MSTIETKRAARTTPPRIPVQGGLGHAVDDGRDPHHDHHHARRWLILVVLGLAQLMVVLDVTVVNIALPTAQADLGFGDGDRQWVVTAYTLAFGSLLLFGGRLTDLLGRKLTLIIGLVGFAAASALGGAATTFGMLVAARAVQGAFAALLAPAVLSLLTTVFARGKERGVAFGIFGAIAGGGTALGLLLGGALTEYFSWRWTMYINIVFAVVAIVGGLILLRGGRTTRHPGLDLPGTLTVTAGLFALVYGFSHAETDGWNDPMTIGLLVASAVLIAGFVVIERFAKRPLLPMRILVDRDRAGGFAAMFLATMGMFAVFLFMTYYMQQNLHYSAVATGVAFLPMPGMLIVTAAVVGPFLQRRVSPKLIMPAGLILSGVALALLTRIGVVGDYASDILPSLLILGVGLGLVFSTGTSIATLGIAHQDAGVASATLNAVQQVGGSIGTALLNTIATSAVAAYITAHATSAQPDAALLGAAAVHGYTVAFWVGAAIFGAAALASGLLLRRGVPAGMTDHGEEQAIIHA